MKEIHRKAKLTLADKLMMKLQAMGHEIPGEPGDWCLRRTYAGWVQQSAGAFTWVFEWQRDGSPQWYGLIGGNEPASECLRDGFETHTNSFGDIHLIKKDKENE